MSYIRKATHAAPHGTGWYESIPDKLRSSIENWLALASTGSGKGSESGKISESEGRLPSGRLLGVIAPHAGLRYGGPTAATAYRVAQEYLRSDAGQRVETIFIMGPSHHKGFRGIEISDASVLQTPLGDIPVHVEVVKDIVRRLRSRHIPISPTSQKTDEEEHSIEMQLPFISAVLPATPPKGISSVQLVPMIVGFMDQEMEEETSLALQPYFEDEKNFFVFSSDFSHWGRRFEYTYEYREKGRDAFKSIADAIQAMDLKAVDILAAKDVRGWYRYFDETDNTICGRHPIGIGLHYWHKLPSASVQLRGYAQSNRVTSTKDSSVSYAAATIFV